MYGDEFHVIQAGSYSCHTALSAVWFPHSSQIGWRGYGFSIGLYENDPAWATDGQVYLENFGSDNCLSCVNGATDNLWELPGSPVKSHWAADDDFSKTALLLQLKRNA